MLGFVLATWSCPAVADDREPVRLRYKATEGCPAATTFADEVSARTRRARPAMDGEAARTFEARIEHKGAKYVGRLRIQAPGGASEVRKIATASCEQVASALALFTALAIDPTASVEDGPLDRAKPAQPDATMPKEAAPTPAPAKEARPPPPAPAETAARTTGPSSGWRWRLGVDVLAMSAAAPSGVYGAAIVAEMSPTDPAPFAPRLRFSIGYAQSLEAREGPGLVLVRLPYAAAAACPLEIALATDLDMDLCAGARGGILVARGTDVDAPRTAALPWVDVNAFARVAGSPTKRWRIEAMVGVLAPVTRYTLVFDYPLTVAYTPSAAGVWGGVGCLWGG